MIRVFVVEMVMTVLCRRRHLRIEVNDGGGRYHQNQIVVVVVVDRVGYTNTEL